jgi:membrane-bound lytic murein transglycosylase D
MELRTAVPTALIVGVVLGLSIVGLERSAARRGEPAPIAALAVAELATVPVRWDIPVVWNESVRGFVNLFSGEQSDRMALYLKRSGRYEGMIRTKLRERGMPEDLLYLSMIESGFNPNARSRAQAVGLWQFMAGTARDYGLRVDGYVDERRDPEKSTDAALRYLQDLHGQFGSWNLAAAAYNTGEVRVSRAMRATTGAEKGVETDFWRIRRLLPRDTREYVPLIYAAALVGKDPQKYGLGNVERWLPVPTDTVAVPGGTELETVAQAVGTTEADLRSLNPQLVKGVTPPGKAYPVRVPDGSGAHFALER